jgi:hypothetical protein
VPPWEVQRSAKVNQSHEVTLAFPELAEGTELEIIVRQVPALIRGKRQPGSAKGQIRIMPGFDDPIEGFEEHL